MNRKASISELTYAKRQANEGQSSSREGQVATNPKQDLELAKSITRLVEECFGDQRQMLFDFDFEDHPPAIEHLLKGANAWGTGKCNEEAVFELFRHQYKALADIKQREFEPGSQTHQLIGTVMDALGNALVERELKQDN